MIASKQDFILKIHLIISVLVVVPASFIYGFQPDYLLDIHLKTIDENNFFKAIMGLYLGVSILWALGIFKAHYLRLALTSNIIFMLGLGFGRIVSLLLDGTPTIVYVFGTFAELFLGGYGFWVLNKYKDV